MKDYYELNGKGRFYRTLWFFPVALPLLAAVLWLGDDSSRMMRFLIGSPYIKITILAVCFILGIVQLMGNYKAWKREEKLPQRPKTVLESPRSEWEHSLEIIIPHCSIRNEIDAIVTLIAKQRITKPNMFKRAAPEYVIRDWERTHGTALPEQYRDWLMFSNGSQIHGQLVNIFGLDEIGKAYPFIPDHLVYICDMVSDFEYLCFEKSTGRIVSFLDVYNEAELKVYDDFRHFLNSRVIRHLEDAV